MRGSRLAKCAQIIVTFGMLAMWLVVGPSASAGIKDLSRYQVLQYNMWGAFGSSPGVNTRSPAFIAAWVIFTPDATRPLSITLNEVCKEAGFDYVNQALTPLGYSGRFMPAVSVPDGGYFNGSFHPWGQNGYTIIPGFNPNTQESNCRSFGNAVFVRNPIAAEVEWWYSWQDLSTHEYRNYVCVKTTYPVFWQCSTHLSVSGTYAGVKIAVYQLNEYKGVTQGRLADGVTTIPDGDFNLTPTELDSWWFTTLKDSDLQCTSPWSTGCEKTLTDNTRTIDYQFRAVPRTWSYDSYMESTLWSGQPASDHKLVVGYP